MNNSKAARPLVDAALQMVVKGLAVIPWHDTASGHCSCQRGKACTSPGKHPRPQKWTEKGSRNADQIVQWWKQWPNANVGIVTGQPSKVFVLDFDVRNGGKETLDNLFDDFPEIAGTFRVKTGGGGWHLYFQNPEGGVKTNAGVMPGMDVRGDGGGVISPGSIHISGRHYHIENDGPFLACPAKLLEMVCGWTQERHKSNSGASQESRKQYGSDAEVKRKTQVMFESLSSTQQQQLDRAIKLSLPKQEGTRHKSGFTFARRLQSVEGFDQTTDPETLRLIIKRFQDAMMAAAKKQGFVIRGTFVDTFNDVRYCWDKIHTPADQVMAGVIEKVADAFSNNDLPEPVADCLTALAYDDDRDTSLLVALCWHLDQLWEGQGFYLSVRAGESALKQLGASDAATFQWVSRRMNQLSRDGVIVCTKPSKPGQRNVASEFIWTWSIPESV
jgi:hypothetical protein